MLTSLIAAGLLLDILGAAVIALPDIPLFNRLTGFGKLRIGEMKMESGGVSRGETGFSEVKAMLNGIDPAHDFGDGGRFVEIVVNRRGGFMSDKIKQSGITWGEEYVEARRGEDADLDNTAFYEVGEIFRKVRDTIEPNVTWVRVAGFLTLSAGFLLQLLGTVLNSPA